MTCDGYLMVFGMTDRKLGLIDAAARCIANPRKPALITNIVRDMLCPSVYEWRWGGT